MTNDSGVLHHRRTGSSLSSVHVSSAVILGRWPITVERRKTFLSFGGKLSSGSISLFKYTIKTKQNLCIYVFGSLFQSLVAGALMLFKFYVLRFVQNSSTHMFYYRWMLRIFWLFIPYYKIQHFIKREHEYIN